MNIQAIQEEIIDEFSMFDDWDERFQYVIDLGKNSRPSPNRILPVTVV